ncbi:unknown protein [Seminavis robusta]|uniref:Ankyrin repeat-containing domain n=1 Tax=Seminavis robusta TaxID=568900 RepID=A0A9N8HVR7_9STRA|nr:unknown protein [Seminavis robusta]|eukprot:Sro1542_g281031.1  (461) ;mRNA; r:6139-7521
MHPLTPRPSSPQSPLLLKTNFIVGAGINRLLLYQKSSADSHTGMPHSSKMEEENSSKRGLSTALPEQQKRAKHYSDIGKDASDALSRVLEQLQEENSNSKAEAAHLLETALALQEQVKAIVHQAGSNLRLVPEESCLKHGDIWVNEIFSFLGMGQFAFVAPVSHRMKDLYQAYCDSVDYPPLVFNEDHEIEHNSSYEEDLQDAQCSATPSDTFYGAIFSSVPRAEYWYIHCETGAGGRNLLSCTGTIVCSTAAKVGSRQVLQWGRKKRFGWDQRTCFNAAGNGRLEVLKYAHENDCPWNESTCSGAAANGHLEVLKYAHEEGCPWDNNTCSNAAKKGHLEILKYAHENGCPWGNTTCSNAAENGQFEILKYAHENGCPWDEGTCSGAAGNTHLDILKYAHENNCPWDSYTSSKAAQYGHLEVLRYAFENGCPWSDSIDDSLWLADEVKALIQEKLSQRND